MATQLITGKEKARLQEIFIAMDKNADGKLSRDELIAGYFNIESSAVDVEMKVDQIMNAVDIDHSGYIDYSEFILALMNKKRLLSKENLAGAFKLFDKDNSGTITADEIKNILGVGKTFSEEVWVNILKEVDNNSDGKISFEEFETMMNRFIKQ